jgi:chaperone required for assembly of F1-ATPase
VKRFYKEATAGAPGAEGIPILLDGRGVKTPARAALSVPTPALADAIVAEWQAQGDTIDPRTMPMTGLANAAIDRVAPNPAAFAAPLAAYGETDLLCYRADAPASLVAAQAQAWDPLLDWARRRYDVTFAVTAGIVHQPQPPATIRRLAEALAARAPFALVAFAPLVTISGSLVIALALAEGWIEADTAFDTAHLDELWQVQHWGEDALATRMREDHRRDFVAGARFLALVSLGAASPLVVR